MPIIENYADHNFEFPIEKWEDNGGKRIGGTKKLVFPKLANETDEASGEARQKPGSLEVSTEELKLLREHYVAKSWFDRNGLVVRESAAAPPDKKRA